MKNTATTEHQSFTDLLANKKLTKENMHEAIETVAGRYMGFLSSAYQLDCSSNGTECITVFAHYHGGKCYCGSVFISNETPALEAISTALVKLNENIRLGFKAKAQPSPLECLEIQNHSSEVITDAFLSENETADLRTPFVAA